MDILNIIFVTTLLVGLCAAKNTDKNVAAFKVRGGSWTVETTTSSYMSSDVMNAMCKNAHRKDDSKSDESEKEAGTEETDDETKEASSTQSPHTDSFSMTGNKKSCYACFSRISPSPYQTSTVMQDELEKCSQMYLAEGQFRNCVEELTKPHSGEDSIDVTTSRKTPQRNARDFTECVYAQLKRDMIQTCIDDVAMSSTEPEDKIKQFLNTTTCVLSKFQCANFSVSTGASRMLGQHQTVAALAVATTGDLHVFRVSDIMYGPGWTQTRFSSAEWQGSRC